MPDIDIAQELDALDATNPDSPPKTVAAGSATQAHSPLDLAPCILASVLNQVLPDTPNDPDDGSSDEDEEELDYINATGLKRISIASSSPYLFYGKSSAAALMHSAYSHKRYMQEDYRNPGDVSSASARRPEFWRMFPVSLSQSRPESTLTFGS